MLREIELEVWPPEQGKGLDDLLAAGGTPTCIPGEEVPAYLEKLASAMTGGPVNGEVDKVAANQMEQPKRPEAAAPGAEFVSTTDTPPSVQGPDRFPYGVGKPAEFPLEFFPAALQVVAQEIGSAINCPVDFPGCAMVSVAAAAIGRSRDFEIFADYKVGPRLYVGLVGAPGSGKTPAIRKVMRPLWRQEEHWRDQHAQAKKAHELEMDVYDIAKKEYLTSVREKKKAKPAEAE